MLAAGHETTAGSLAWALERLAHHPEVLGRIRDGDEEYLDATVKEVLRVRPGAVDRRPPRRAQPFEVGGHVLPPGVHVAPCIYLAHRRAAGVAGADRVPARALPRRHARRPTRTCRSAAACAAARAPRSPRWRCARCCARSPQRFALRPAGRAASERMRRGSVTLVPTGGRSDRAGAATTICEMASLFCRHNRLTANCPICSRELREPS